MCVKDFNSLIKEGTSKVLTTGLNKNSKTT